MITHGKILFYNELSGDGIIITKDKQKFKFNIENWNDFERMPALGLAVYFNLENTLALDIVVLENVLANTEKTNINLDDNSTEDIIKTNLVHSEEKTQITQDKEKTKLTSDKGETNTYQNEEILPAQKYKDESLNKAEEELTALLSNCSNTLESLNKKISLTSSVITTMRLYLDSIKKDIKKREGYNKVDGRLDYNLSRRFLWTTYNNLIEIDRDIMSTRIKSIGDDLKFMSILKDSFDKKTNYPATAFEEIFLSSQPEYKAVKILTKQSIEKFNFLKNKEKSIAAQKKLQIESIKKCKNNQELEVLNQDLKTINGTYADIVHMMATLKEIHRINSKRLKRFEETYKEDFFKVFKSESVKYKAGILNILNAQAYLLDFLLWKEARASQNILNHFKSLAIDAELNTKTYLKFFLDTLDQSKSNEASKDLFALYEHLVEMQKEYVLVVASSAQDAMEYESNIKQSNNSYSVKSFINELQCIKWASLNTVKAIVIEETLQVTNATKFLDYYHKHIYSKPKILLIGNNSDGHSKDYVIHKTLPSNISARVLSKEVNILLSS